MFFKKNTSKEIFNRIKGFNNKVEKIKDENHSEIYGFLLSLIDNAEDIKQSLIEAQKENNFVNDNLKDEITSFKKNIDILSKYIKKEEIFIEGLDSISLIKELENESMLPSARNKASLSDFIEKNLKNKLSNPEYNSEKNLNKKIIENKIEFAAHHIFKKKYFDFTFFDIFDEFLEENEEDFQLLINERMDDNQLFWRIFEFSVQEEDIEWTYIEEDGEEKQKEYWDFPEDLREEHIKPYEVYEIVKLHILGKLERVKNQVLESPYQFYLTEKDEQVLYNIKSEISKNTTTKNIGI